MRASQNCVKHCFQKFDQLQKVFASKQQQVSQALSACATNCQNNAKLAQPTQNSTFEEQEKFKQEALSCLVTCPRSVAPLIEKVFTELSETLK